MDFIHQLGASVAGDVAARVDVEGVYRRGDYNIGFEGNKFFAVLVGLSNKLEHGEHTFRPIAFILRCWQPDVVDAVEGLARGGGLVFAQMGESGADDGDVVSHANPFACHIVGTELHSIFRCASVVAYH